MEGQVETEPRAAGGQFSESIERLWEEIKQISKQVERETRRSGRVARLRLDIRGLKREVFEVSARLGKAVHEARTSGGDNLRLHEVQGLAGGVAALDALYEQIRAKEEEIAGLGEVARDSHQESAAGPDEVAEEPASG